MLLVMDLACDELTRERCRGVCDATFSRHQCAVHNVIGGNENAICLCAGVIAEVDVHKVMISSA
jgi:hypothetical protein